MISRTALIVALALTLPSTAHAETYLNPDRPWWKQFFAVVDGTSPDFEAAAKQDMQYQSANEFDRDGVLVRLVAQLREQYAQIDTASAEITINMRSQLGDYSSAQNGFPVSLFAPNMRLQLDGSDLYFRNFESYSIFPASKGEGQAFRTRIGTQPLIASLTLTNIRKSTTRPRAYDGFVRKVTYTAKDGLVVAEFTATENAPLPADVAADQLAAVRKRLVEMAGIPPLGTPWSEAKATIQSSYPFIASDVFAYTDRGKRIAYQYDNGAAVMDVPHEADKAFRVYLQQAEGGWRTTRGFSVNLNGGDSISTKGTGPGLACYTPDVLDRCAVLEFSPADGGHVLTRAYGVIELERTETPRAAIEGLVGDSMAAFGGFTTKLDYDLGSLKQGQTPKFSINGGVTAYAASAGQMREGSPFYDPLQNTTNTNPITREIALFAVDGAPNRIPLIFVLQ